MNESGPARAQNGGDVPMLAATRRALGRCRGRGQRVFHPSFGSSSSGGGASSSPAVVDGVVYVGGDDSNLYALDTATGAEVSRFETVNAPLLAGGRGRRGLRGRH